MLTEQILHITKVHFGALSGGLFILLGNLGPDIVLAPDLVNWQLVPIKGFHLLLWFWGFKLGQAVWWNLINICSCMER